MVVPTLDYAAKRLHLVFWPGAAAGGWDPALPPGVAAGEDDAPGASDGPAAPSVPSLGGGTGDRAAIDTAFAAIAAHEAVLGEKLLSYLRERNDVRVIGRRDAGQERRVPTIAFKVEGRDAAISRWC